MYPTVLQLIYQQRNEVTSMGILRVRIPDELEKRLDQLVEILQKQNPATEVSRSSVVRYALEKIVSEEKLKKEI